MPVSHFLLRVIEVLLIEFSSVSHEKKDQHNLKPVTATNNCLIMSLGWKTPDANWTCFDLVNMIRQQVRASPITWKKRYVLGHQDGNEPYKDLSAEAKANVITDEETKEELKKGIVPGVELWKLDCNGQRICGDTETRLRKLMQEKESRLWCEKKVKIPDDLSKEVDWFVYSEFRDRTPKWLNKCSVKFGADILPTMKNLGQLNQSQSDACP